MCSIVTVGWDHMESLGDTLEKIAIEKAGIIKSGVPVIVGQATPHKVIEAIAIDRKSDFILASIENDQRNEKSQIKSDIKFME